MVEGGKQKRLELEILTSLWNTKVFNREVRISSSNLPFSSFLCDFFFETCLENFEFHMRHYSSLKSFIQKFFFECNSKYTSSRLGLDGYQEVRNGQELSPWQQFTVFEGNGVTRTVLGPASFINHSCEPNVNLDCGGATKLIVRLYLSRDSTI